MYTAPQEATDNLQNPPAHLPQAPKSKAQSNDPILCAEDKKTITIFPIADNIIFPHLISPILVRNKSQFSLFKKAFQKKEPIGIIANKTNKKIEKKSHLHSIGTAVQILRIMKLHDGHHIVAVEGTYPFKLLTLEKSKTQFKGQVEILEDKPLNIQQKDIQAIISSIKQVALQILEATSRKDPDISKVIKNESHPLLLVHYIAANFTSIPFRQQLLNIRDTKKRAKQLLKYLMEALEMNKIKEKIQHQLYSDISKEQKEMFLRRQIKAIQKELNEDEEEPEINHFLKRAQKKKWSRQVEKHFQEIMEQVQNVHPHSPEYANTMRYVNLLLDLPWGITTQDRSDLQQAEKILQKNHYGMEKVKERLLEFLAVHALKKGETGITLCLIGPPGVGKTTIANSIAEALKRKIIKISLAGVHDEAKLMGHARTYVASKEGAILAGLKQAQSTNPIILLDEVDKMDYLRSGGPESILAILDSSQQKEFKDNYIDVPFDISKALFIATANDISNLSHPLRDRLEIIEIEGYATEEKIEIAQKHLIPKQRKSHGLSAKDLQITKNALQNIIEHYTSESGVRDLSRQIGTIARKIAKYKVSQATYTPKIEAQHLEPFLEIPKFQEKETTTIDLPGKAIGLSWSQVGGSLLPIEASAYPGKGNITLSGQLGKVMQESARVALSLIKTQAENLHIDHRIFKQYDLHIHSAPGFISKEGPSAGITLAAAIASLYTQRKIKDKIAMTGEITLQGKVRPVGGIKEKVLAAKRSGIQAIILNTYNKKQVEQIKKKYLRGLTFHYVDTIHQAFDHILEYNPITNPKKWQLTSEKKN